MAEIKNTASKEKSYEKKWKQKKFMLSGWLLTWHTDNERLDDYVTLLKEAGVDLLLFDGSTDTDFDKIYDSCQRCGMKVLSTAKEIAYDEEGKPYHKGIIKQPEEINEEKIRLEIERLKKKYPDTIIGHYIWDEPNVMMFDKMVETTNIVRKYAPDSLMYSVILPSYGRYVWPDVKITYDTEAARQTLEFMEKNASGESSENIPSYPEYVDKYCEALNPEILAQDYYPFQQHGLDTSLKTSMLWKDMGYLRKVAKERGMEYWQCISGATEWDWTTCDMDVPRIRVHLNACIAYGCSGVQYFPLHEAIIMLKTPEKSDKYDQLRLDNIKAKNIGNILFHTESKALYHTAGYDNPKDIFADDIKSSQLISSVECSADAGLIISEFKGEESTYTVIVNKEHTSSAYGKIKLRKECVIGEYDAINNSFLIPVKTSEIEYRLEAGEILLFKID